MIYNTKALLMVESLGGLLTSGRYLKGLDYNSELHDWYNMFPEADTDLITDWYAYVNAKHELENTINKLSNKDA